MSSSPPQPGWEMFVHVIHPLVKVFYFCLMIVLAVLWPSFSMLFLGFFHLLGVFYHWWRRGGDAPTKSKNMLTNLINGVAFHLENSSTVMNKVHFALLVGTFLSFFHYYEQNGAAVSIKLAKADLDKLITTGIDHTSLGTDAKKFSSLSVQDLHPAELAQQGYYFAERYVGKVGMIPNTVCNSSMNTTYGWNCFVVGVRHYYGGKNPDDTFFQPLPTPAYRVDLMVATDDSEAGANLMCNNLDAIYVQRVDANGNILVPMRPLFEGGDGAAAGTAGVAVCPDTLNNVSLGCTASTFPKTHAQYKAALAAVCQANSDKGGLRQTTSDGVHASFIPIPGADITVDPHTGRITYTVIIMRTTTKNVSQPVLRVTVNNPVADGSYTFFTPKTMLPVPATGHDIYDDIKNRYTGQKTYPNGFMLPQRYGDNFTATVASKNIPQDYFRTNTYVIFWTFTILFLFAVMISWYYMVTDAFNTARAYDETGKSKYSFKLDPAGRPLYVIALFVKVPIAIVALATGMWGYAAAVGSHAIAYMVVETKKDARERKPNEAATRNMIYLLFCFIAWCLYIAVIIIWFLAVVGDGRSYFELMFFPAFVKERVGTYMSFIIGNPASLISNYFLVFVLTDSFASFFVTTARVLGTCASLGS